MNTSASFFDLERATRLLLRGLRLKCPRCGQGPLFRRGFSMPESCAVCGLRFEREQGYFVGAIYLNSAGTVLVLIGGGLVLHFAGVSLIPQLVIAATLSVLVPVAFFRYSKSLWLAMDYFLDPEGPPERPSWADPAGGSRPAPARRGPAIPPDEPARVECSAGGRAEETPRRLLVGDRWEELTILDRWVTEPAEGGHRTRWFRVRLERGTAALIYHDEGLDLWFWRSLAPAS